MCTRTSQPHSSLSFTRLSQQPPSKSITPHLGSCPNTTGFYINRESFPVTISAAWRCKSMLAEHCRCSRRSTSARIHRDSRLLRGAARPRQPRSVAHAVTQAGSPASAAWASLPCPTVSSRQCSHGARLQPCCASPPEHLPGEAKARLAVFVSGGGSNFKAIHAACLAGTINADVVVSVSSQCCQCMCAGVSWHNNDARHQCGTGMES